MVKMPYLWQLSHQQHPLLNLTQNLTSLASFRLFTARLLPLVFLDFPSVVAPF